MSLTRAQQRLAEAYRTCFTGPDAQLVLDDLVLQARGLGEPLERAGAMELVAYILSRVSLQRRTRLLLTDLPIPKRPSLATLEGL